MSSTLGWNANRSCFIRSGTGERIRGITTVIRKCFYPCYHYKKATLGQDVQGPRPAGNGKKVSVKRRQQNGLDLGKRIDREMIVFTSLLQTKQSQMCAWIPGSCTHEPCATWRTTDPAFAAFQAMSHTRSQQLIRTLYSEGLRPIAAQCGVQSKALKLATSLDLVCEYLDPTKNKASGKQTVVLVEVKCGFDGYYLKHTPVKMNAPFADLDDSPFHQHQIQLLVERILAEASWPTENVDIADCVVIRMVDSGSHVYRLQKYIRDRMALVRWVLSQRLLKKKKNNSKKKQTSGMPIHSASILIQKKT